MPIERNIPEKKGLEKSALYPAVTIEQSIEFVKQIESLGGKAVSYASILSLLKLSSPSTKSFLSRISASKQFGFITTGGSTVQLTDSARHILNPTTDDEKKRLLAEAFNKPPLYIKLLERFKNKALPQKEQLSNILMHEYHIIKSVKDRATECFIKSAESVGLLQNGILYAGLDENDIKNENICKNDKPIQIKENTDAQTEQITQPAQETQEQTQNQIQTQAQGQAQNNLKTGYNFEIPILSGQTAKFYIPDGVSEKDIDYIKLYVEKMLPVFLDNLKVEIGEE